MRDWDSEGIHILTYKEEKELLKNKTDHRFDKDYNALTYNMFCHTGELFSEVFTIFEHRLSSLHRYLEYSRRYFEEYILIGKKVEEDMKVNRIVSAEEYDLFTETFYSDKEYLETFNYEAILLMLYSTFEQFVIEVCKDASNEYNVVFAIPYNNKPIIIKHIDFLRNVQWILTLKKR